MIPVMQLLIVSTTDHRLGLFATPTPAAVLALMAGAVEIDRHYAIATPRAQQVEAHLRRRLAPYSLGGESPWYGLSLNEAIDHAARAITACGADDIVIRGAIRPKLRVKWLGAV